MEGGVRGCMINVVAGLGLFRVWTASFSHIALSLVFETQQARCQLSGGAMAASQGGEQRSASALVSCRNSGGARLVARTWRERLSTALDWQTDEQVPSRT